jgi:hypothetical protein
MLKICLRKVRVDRGNASIKANAGGRMLVGTIECRVSCEEFLYRSNRASYSFMLDRILILQRWSFPTEHSQVPLSRQSNTTTRSLLASRDSRENEFSPTSPSVKQGPQPTLLLEDHRYEETAEETSRTRQTHPWSKDILEHTTNMLVESKDRLCRYPCLSYQSIISLGWGQNDSFDNLNPTVAYATTITL